MSDLPLNQAVSNATLYLTVQGQQVAASSLRCRVVDYHWQSGNSYLRIGWQWIEEFLSGEGFCKNKG